MIGTGREQQATGKGIMGMLACCEDILKGQNTALFL
jgi:hypothetical protein